MQGSRLFFACPIGITCHPRKAVLACVFVEPSKVLERLLLRWHCKGRRWIRATWRCSPSISTTTSDRLPFIWADIQCVPVTYDRSMPRLFRLYHVCSFHAASASASTPPFTFKVLYDEGVGTHGHDELSYRECFISFPRRNGPAPGEFPCCNHLEEAAFLPLTGLMNARKPNGKSRTRSGYEGWWFEAPRALSQRIAHCMFRTSMVLRSLLPVSDRRIGRITRRFPVLLLRIGVPAYSFGMVFIKHLGNVWYPHSLS